MKQKVKQILPQSARSAGLIRRHPCGLHLTPPSAPSGRVGHGTPCAARRTTEDDRFHVLEQVALRAMLRRPRVQLLTGS